MPKDRGQSSDDGKTSIRSSDGPEGIDRIGVERWFAENVAESELPLAFERICGGRSNLTYVVTDAAARRFALRRPPLGRRLASAHDMGREQKIISALQATAVPVPRIIGYCEDERVTGAPFYVMEFVEGPVLRSRDDAEDFDQEERHHIGLRVADVLVALHGLNPDEVSLGDLGRKEGYVVRQLRRWRGQWEGSRTRGLPVIDDLYRRLAARVPEQGRATIVHGDYRLDNLILTEMGEIAAVVDWELCTLGDPLADVGLLMVYWSEPGDALIPLFQAATTTPGFPSRDELCARYAERSGRDLSELDFYVALGYWKLAIILEGVYARHHAGQYGRVADGFDRFPEMVERLAAAADQTERSEAS